MDPSPHFRLAASILATWIICTTIAQPQHTTQPNPTSPLQRIAKNLNHFESRFQAPEYWGYAGDQVKREDFKRETLSTATEHSESLSEHEFVSLAESEQLKHYTTGSDLGASVDQFKPIHTIESASEPKLFSGEVTQYVETYPSGSDLTPKVHEFKPIPAPVKTSDHSERRVLDLTEQSHLSYSNGDFVSRLERSCRAKSSFACVQRMLVNVVDNALSKDSFELMSGVTLVRNRGSRRSDDVTAADATDIGDYVVKRIANFAQNHVLRVDLSPITSTARNARFLFGLLRPKWLDIFSPTETGKTGTFLTGFGLGFLAFGLKKLLLPIFIAAQIVKSVLIAMFLPSILGGLGKIVGKGVSTFAQSSSGLSGGLSGGGLHGEASNTIEDFEFKDQNDLMDNHDTKAADSKYSYSFNYPDAPYPGGYQPVGTLPAASIYMPGNTRYQNQANAKVSYVADNNNNNGNYYQRHQPNKQDYKVFHDIPSSSLLLTTYDPFYSPLLSRLDSVYKQLGYDTEKCRERLVCAMYRNPAKFAPYSNLVSAQLSRELNELRKPASDNSEILRFFRYMKAAKNGQDGLDCYRLHPGCIADTAVTHPPMVKTYNDINKLVQARRLARQMGGAVQQVSAKQVSEDTDPGPIEPKQVLKEAHQVPIEPKQVSTGAHPVPIEPKQVSAAAHPVPIAPKQVSAAAHPVPTEPKQGQVWTPIEPHHVSVGARKAAAGAPQGSVTVQAKQQPIVNQKSPVEPIKALSGNDKVLVQNEKSADKLNAKVGDNSKS